MMVKEKELKGAIGVVKDVLESNTAARNSDMVLYIEVCRRINPELLYKPFWFVLANIKNFKLPTIETVGRARRKIQERYPELSADADVEACRMLNEEIFKGFARGIL